MADKFTKHKRSQIMRAVKSQGNKSTEIKFIQILRQFKITGWRRSYRLFGNPDFVFPVKRVVVFTDGCFWHGHNCRNIKPKANAEYWIKKIKSNKKRDKKVTKTLMNKNWKVIRIWECKIKKGILSDKLKLNLLGS